MTTFMVTQGNGYAVMSRGHGYEIHDTETLDVSYCCDRGCGLRYLDAIGVPPEVPREHPLGHGAGDYIEMRADANESHGEYPVYSWGDYPCPETSSHEYCPACGALTVHGIDDASGDPYTCDGSECDAPAYVAPDPCMPYPDLDEFVRGYVECALWSSSVEEEYGAANDMAPDTSMDSAGFSADDIAEEAMSSMRDDCSAFARHNRLDVEEYVSLMGTWHGSDTVRGANATYSAAEQAGVDFWLSRNGHGAGYFDRGNDPVFGRLQDAARVY